MIGRYPDYDVLAEARHWDAETRRVVLDRVENVPPIRFFTPAETSALKAFCDVVTAQRVEPRVPVLAYIDEKLHDGGRDGWQYFDLPDDDEVWSGRRAGSTMRQESGRSSRTLPRRTTCRRGSSLASPQQICTMACGRR
jgi:hypothetical protein